MKRFGTKYGGWTIPYPDNDLNENSIIYSVGVGEDISFDIKLQSLYNCKIFLIDPTIKAKQHFLDCKKYFTDKTFRFSSNIQKDYYSEIENENPDLEKFTYIDLGLWNKKDRLKFYKQNNENYVSRSLIDNFFSDKYDIVEVDSLKNIMEIYNHSKIDLLKLDIEGAEIVVLRDMIKNKIFPKYLCVEFDLLLKKKIIII
jgi:FkbM family methyltransferase